MVVTQSWSYHIFQLNIDPMKHRKQMCSRLMALGLTKSESSQLLEKLAVWISHNGQEWTVEHLKEVKLAFLHKLAGGPKFVGSHWIAKDKNGVPKGPVKALFRLSRKNLSKVLTAFTSYSYFLASEVTQKQMKKFFSSMESSDTRGMDASLHMVVKPVVSAPSTAPTFIEYCVSPNKRAPSSNGRTALETDHLTVFQHALSSKAVRNIIFAYPDLFKEVIPLSLVKGAQVPAWTRNYDLLDTLGHISGIQEPGFKLRAVANPSRVLQCVLEPLKRGIESVLRGFSTDYTFDQQRAIPVIQSWLRERRTVYSVDLSDATNLFPWPLQRRLLEETFLHPRYQQLIDIMDRAATGPWITRLRGEPETVRFTRGQPLGLGPSFFTFAYAHNTLLAGICAKHGLNEDFCVLGDDVVIAGEQLHKIYRRTLDNLGARVSPTKTFKSQLMAEFAGFVVLADRVGHGYKWRQMSDYSFIEAARNLGKCALGMMNPYQRAVTTLMAPFPKGFGGLGWSNGRKLSEVTDPLLDKVMEITLKREDGSDPMMYRDLIADWIHFVNTAVSDDSWPWYAVPECRLPADKIRISDIIPNPRVILADNGGVRPLTWVPWLDERPGIGYYPVFRPSGDPRPSVYSAVKQLVAEARAKGLKTPTGVRRWLSQRFGDNDPRLSEKSQKKRVVLKKSVISRNPRKGLGL